MTALASRLETTRLTFRLHRFELVAFTALGLLAAGLAWLVAWRLDGLRLDPACFDAAMRGEISVACEVAMNAFGEVQSNEAGKVTILTTGLPFLAGLVLGIPVVGRELERGTTRLAWALAPSRLRWFLQRLVPVLLFVAALGWLLATASERLMVASHPGLDPANSFDGLGFRGAPLAFRALFVFALAVHVGSVMGRALPALIVGGILAFAAITGGAQVHQQILKAEAVELTEGGPGDMYIDQRFRLADGRLIGWEEIEQYDPMPTDPMFSGEWPTLPQVTFGIPGTRYREVELREVAALAGGSLVALLLTAVVVQRRRPG